MHTYYRTCGLFFLLAFATIPTTNASPFTFTQIAGTTTSSLSNPGQLFDSFGKPSISGNTVAFWAQTPDFRSASNGIYAGNGTSLRIVADQSSRPGDPTGAFFNFGDPSISGNNVAFHASFAPNDQSQVASGLFLQNASGITKLVDSNTASLSNPGQQFGSFGKPSISGNTVAFWAQTPDFRGTSNGIYAGNGTSLRIVADQSSRPGDPTGAFFNFGDPSISGNNVAFHASFAPNDQSQVASGLFLQNASGITKLVDSNTASLSNPGQQFGSFGKPSISGNSVAFWAQTPDFRGTSNGIYAANGTSLRIVADQSSRPGDPTGAFFNFGDPSISGNNVAFLASFAPNDQSQIVSGLFVSLDGVLEDIINTGDLLDGLVVSGLEFGDQGIDGDSVTFLARFTDGSSAVYRADTSSVPEPNSLLLVAVAVCSLLLVRRNRGRITLPDQD